MNTQRFIGLSLGLISNLIIYNISGDWRLIALAIIGSTGGVIYGDAD